MDSVTSVCSPVTSLINGKIVSGYWKWVCSLFSEGCKVELLSEELQLSPHCSQGPGRTLVPNSSRSEGKETERDCFSNSQ